MKQLSSYGLGICLSGLLVLAAVPQDKHISVSQSVSGKVFLITGVGDLKPARFAHLVLLHSTQTGVNSAAVVYLHSASEAMKTYHDSLTDPSEAISCRAKLLVVDTALKDTLEWARKAKQENQILAADTDSEGRFRYSGVIPGYYDLVARGRAGANAAHWEHGFRVRPHQNLTLNIGSPETACLLFALE